MSRVLFAAALLIPITACGAKTLSAESTATSPQLFRGAGNEVRLRCGSQALRARLRQGQVLAEVGNRESAVLAPVNDPRAAFGPAYSDGKLTLYKMPDTDSWALASGASGGVPCTRDTGN